MATEVIYYLDPGAAGSGDRWPTLPDIETAYGNPAALTTNDHKLTIRVVGVVDISSTYNWNVWGANKATGNYVEVYGWDEANSALDATKGFRVTVNFNSAFQNGTSSSNIYVWAHHLSFTSSTGHSSTGGVKLYSDCRVSHCRFSGLGGAISIENGNPRADHNYIDGVVTGMSLNYFANGVWNNNTIVNCTGDGVKRNQSGSSAGTFSNNVIYNCTTNYNANATFGTARNNAGEVGDTIPDTVGGTSISISDPATTFADHVGGGFSGFHIRENGVCHHGNVGYPTGNNTYKGNGTDPATGAIEDADRDLLPTYTTDADRWDTGMDYWVPVITGTTWLIDASVSVSDATVIKEEGNEANTTTLGAISPSTDRDTLKITEGAVAAFDGYNNVRGFSIDIEDGEVILRNTSTTAGMQHFGWTEKNIVVGALGKLTIEGLLIEIGTVSSLAAADWTGKWTGLDDGSQYAEPGVIFVGVDSASAIAYFNKGGRADAVSNDATHGRLFNFDASTGAISFPDNAPAGTDKVYAYNVMLHAKDGQSTNLKSYGIDVSAGGEVDAEGFYTTGALNLTGANGLRLAGVGCIQPIVIDDCAGVELEIYRGISAANPINDTSELKNLSNETLGELHGITPSSTVWKFYGLRSCTLAKVFAESTASPVYLVQIGDASAGTDDLTITALELIGGGCQVSLAISIGLTISGISHSNDVDGSNSNSSQHVLNVGANGTRGLRVGGLSLAAGGLPCLADLFRLQNCGDFEILGVDYHGMVQNGLHMTGCFDGLVSGFRADGFTAQAAQLSGCSDITLQNGHAQGIDGTPAAFAEFADCKDLRFKSWPYQAADRYSGWATPSLPDVNFMELNKWDSVSAWDGVLVFNFSRSTKGIFTLTGTAKSNNSDSVLLPAVADAVEVEWPYAIQVQQATSPFANVAPDLVGAGNYSSFTYEYALNVNGAGYGAWTALTAGNLSVETFTAGDDVRVKLRVTVPSGQADAANAIEQVVIHTAPDADTIAYPVTIVTVHVLALDATTQAAVQGARVYLETAAGGPAAAGIELFNGLTDANGEINFQYGYLGSQPVAGRVRKASSQPRYKTSPLSGSIASSGLEITTFLVGDD